MKSICSTTKPKTAIGIKFSHQQQGFTLIELMVSIVLGLLITAAAVQMLITSQSSVSAQRAVSDIQTDGSFGLPRLIKAIRSANYGALALGKQTAYVLNTDTPHGGIVMSQVGSGVTNANLMVETSMNTSGAILSSLTTPISATGVSASNIDNVESDQLTIQREITENTFDCEGKQVLVSATNPAYLLERYFVRPASSDTDEANELVFACKAAVYGLENVTITDPNDNTKTIDTKQYQYRKRKPTDTSVTTLSGNGTTLINRVDNFRFKLGIDTNDDTAINPANSSLGYVTVAEYTNDSNFSTPKPRVVSVKLSLIVRSAERTRAGQGNNQQKFDIFNDAGASQGLETAVENQAQYQRQLYETTVFIRNARG